MNLDNRIKRELEDEACEIDQAMADSKGLFELALIPFKGGLRRWMFLVSVIILVVTLFMLWTGYRFFVAEGVDERMFWGVWFVVTLIAQVALKQWSWMEINRNSILREIKRVEVTLAKFRQEIGASDTSK